MGIQNQSENAQAQMKEKSRKSLELFLEKSEHLNNIEYLRTPGKIVSYKLINIKDGKGELISNEPTIGETDGLILTLRMFLQKNEQISFEKLEELHKDDGVSRIWKDAHKEVKEWMKLALSQPSYSHPEKGRLDLGEVLDIYLYGHASHLNPPKRKLYEKWVYDENSASMFRRQFHRAAIYILNAVKYLEDYTRLELANDDKLRNQHSE